MSNEELQKIALFRFSLIAPLVNNTYEALSKMEYFRNIASREHKLPDGTEVKLAASTLKKWYLKYMKLGIDGLMPKIRNDAGKPRVINEEAINKIHEIKEIFPYITGKMIYQKLVEEGYIKANNVSLASVHRYLRDNNLKRNQVSPSERKAFEMEFANDCWQADTSVGPKIVIDRIKVQTYLISILDDASRLIVHAQFFLRDNAVNMQEALKKAIAKHGVPKRLFVDNGSSYRNDQLNLICASLGITLIHARPYSSQSKGKIERSFRTIKDGYINSIDWNLFKSLEHLNSEFNTYLAHNYTNRIHSSINVTPKNRYLQDIDKIKYKTELELDNCFLHRVTRKVRNDATIPLCTKFFEVPQKYIGQKINVRYSPLDLSKAYIFDINNNLIDTIYPLKRVDNSKVKRKNTIDYSKMNGVDENV
jgi:transposase InsO family protein